MAIVKGLAALQEISAGSGSSEDRPKGEWLKIKDGETVQIRFLQEIDPDSENYNEKAGSAFIAVEHNNPEKFTRKALCSMEDQGRCFGCEMHRRDPKSKWHGKKRFYANVLVNDGKKDPYVAVLSQGLGSKGIAEPVINWAGVVGSITNVIWSVKRTGTGATDTSYTALPLPANPKNPLPEIDFDKYTLYNLEEVAVLDIPYEDQEAFYFGLSSDRTSSESSPSGTSEVNW